MSKFEASIVFNVGRKLYSYAIYAPKLIETKQVDGLSDEVFEEWLSTDIEQYGIHRFIFYFLPEILLALMIPWSYELAIKPKTFVNIFIEPVLPINHQIADYYFWYDFPKSSYNIPLIACNLNIISPIQALVHRLGKKIEYIYINEITETLNNCRYLKSKNNNIIIPSINDYVTVVVIGENSNVEFLSVMNYRGEITSKNLESFKSFLMLKWFNWFDVKKDKYEVVKPRFIYKNYSNYRRLKNKYLFLFIFATAGFILFIFFILSTANNVDQLIKQRDILQQQNVELPQVQTTSVGVETIEVLPLLMRIDVDKSSGIYIERINSRTIQDNIVSFMIAGKADSFISLEDYINRIRKDENIMNVDILSSFEDMSTIPSVISFEIQVNITNDER